VHGLHLHSEFGTRQIGHGHGHGHGDAAIVAVAPL